MKQITDLASLSKTAEILVNDLSTRERFRARSDLRKMLKALEEKNKSVNKDDFMAVFHALQKMGFGSLVIGRGTNPTRFVWNYNLKDIGLAAKGKIDPSEIQSLKPNGAPYNVKSGGASHKQVVDLQKSVASDGSEVDVLVISPKSGGVQRWKVPGDRAELILKLLGEFGSPA